MMLSAGVERMYYNLAMDDDSFRLAFTGGEGVFAPDLIWPLTSRLRQLFVSGQQGTLFRAVAPVKLCDSR